MSIFEELYEHSPGLAPCAPAIGAAFELLRDALADGRAVLVCGNGGSAADAEHIAAELAKPCALARPLSPETVAALAEAGDDGYLARSLQAGWPVLPLVSQAALLTAIANDQGGDLVFAQQVVAYGRPGDLLLALTTSGASPNVLHALRAARALGLRTLALTGPGGGAVASGSLADVLVALPGAGTPEVQHSHQLVYHALCLALEADRYAP